MRWRRTSGNPWGDYFVTWARRTTCGAAIPETATRHVPFSMKRDGRKKIQLPESAAQLRRTESTLLKELVRTFRWKRIL